MEKPVIRKLYRQSSVEMRLVPNPPPSTDDELDASDSEKSEQPKIVSVTSKIEINPQQGTEDAAVKKTKINLELERILANKQQKTSTDTGAIKKSIQISNDPESVKVQKKVPPQVPPRRSSTISTHRESSLLTNKSEECKIEKKNLDNIIDHEISKTIMASPRPKSPRPPAAVKNEKEESIWDKIGTLGRKKKVREVQEVQAEGKYAIDSPGNPIAPEMPPEDYNLGDNEERSMVEPRSLEEHRVRELMTVLIDWINDELANQRIIVKDLEEDLYDGQVLQKLLEKLTGDKLDVPEVTQSEEGQRQKLAIVLAHADRVLGLSRYNQSKWSVESIHSKNMVAILHLLVHLARHFRAPIRLPENVSVAMVVVQKGQGGQLNHRIVREQITQTYDDLGMRCERDAFDTLFDHAPEKLQVVKKSLVTFVNKHLSKVNLEVTELDSQFHDGVYLTLLMGLLEGFFVPLYCFHLTPQDFEQKVHNVTFAFELMEDVGLAKPKARPEDIVNLDLKSTLRVLYNLFTKYKSIS